MKKGDLVGYWFGPEEEKEHGRELTPAEVVEVNQDGTLDLKLTEFEDKIIKNVPTWTGNCWHPLSRA